MEQNSIIRGLVHMIKKEDIKRAITTFSEWDNKKMWDRPTDVFKHHTYEKSENALKTAQYLLKIMVDSGAKELFNAEGYNGTLWVINAAYYRIFFLSQYLLALEDKKFPEDISDTHKTIELALLYYFIIKGSGLEGKKEITWEEIKESKLSKALELLLDASEEIGELTQQRAKHAVEHMNAERIKRHQFTYKMTFHAEMEKAKTSIKRAIEFGDIIKEYMQAKGLR